MRQTQSCSNAADLFSVPIHTDGQRVRALVSQPAGSGILLQLLLLLLLRGSV